MLYLEQGPSVLQVVKTIGWTDKAAFQTPNLIKATVSLIRPDTNDSAWQSEGCPTEGLPHLPSTRTPRGTESYLPDPEQAHGVTVFAAARERLRRLLVTTTLQPRDGVLVAVVHGNLVRTLPVGNLGAGGRN